MKRIIITSFLMSSMVVASSMVNESQVKAVEISNEIKLAEEKGYDIQVTNVEKNKVGDIEVEFSANFGGMGMFLLTDQNGVDLVCTTESKLVIPFEVVNNLDTVNNHYTVRGISFLTDIGYADIADITSAISEVIKASKYESDIDYSNAYELAVTKVEKTKEGSIKIDFNHPLPEGATVVLGQTLDTTEDYLFYWFVNNNSTTSLEIKDVHNNVELINKIIGNGGDRYIRIAAAKTNGRFQAMSKITTAVKFAAIDGIIIDKPVIEVPDVAADIRIISANGKINDIVEGYAAKNTPIFLTTADGTATMLGLTKSDENGYFHFNYAMQNQAFLDKLDQVKVYYHFSSEVEAEYRVEKIVNLRD